MGDLLGLAFYAALILGAFFIGTILERRHFRDIERREQALDDLIVTTFETTPEDWKIEGAELVSGNVVVSLDYFKRFLGSLRAVFGGRMKVYEPLMDRARREALLRMLETAHARGYRHVINVRLETSRLANARGNGQGTAGVEVLAFGTALRVAAGR